MDYVEIFNKRKNAYLVILLLLALLWAVVSGPMREVFVDISVTPPESARKTDFSWITVNEWFNSQTYIINSYSMLKNVKTKIKITDLGKVVDARRISAADIIKISAKSNASLGELESIVNQLTDLYINYYNATYLEEIPYVSAPRPPLPGITGDELKKLRKEKDNALAGEKEIRLRASINEEQMLKLDEEALSLSKIKTDIDRIESQITQLRKRVDDLRKVYTENWGPVVELNKKISELTQEKKKLLPSLLKLEKVNEERDRLAERVNFDKNKLAQLEREKSALETKIKDAETMPEKRSERSGIASEAKKSDEKLLAHVINPPVLNLFPELGIRLLIGMSFGFLLWLLAGLFFGRSR